MQIPCGRAASTRGADAKRFASPRLLVAYTCMYVRRDEPAMRDVEGSVKVTAVSPNANQTQSHTQKHTKKTQNTQTRAQHDEGTAFKCWYFGICVLSVCQQHALSRVRENRFDDWACCSLCGCGGADPVWQSQTTSHGLDRCCLCGTRTWLMASCRAR